MWLTIWLWKIAPSTAMPVAIPTWRKVLFVPEAIPLRCGSTTEIEAEASTGLTMPMPNPATMKPGRRMVQDESNLMVVMRRRPPVMRSMPTPRR